MTSIQVSSKIYNKIVFQSVCRLRNVHKNRKVTSEIIIDAIIYTLDYLDVNEDYEIEDELILLIEEKYNLPPDQEKESLRQANNMFNKIVSGVLIPNNIKQNISFGCNEEIEEDWKPKSYSKSYEKKKKDWDEIQDRIDLIKNRYECMVHTSEPYSLFILI